MEVKMNDKILNVILAVLAYKRHLYRHSRIIHKDLDLDKETEQYYYSLPLPYGMNKNTMDFKHILSYDSKYGHEILKDLCNTEPENLDKYNWKNF